MQPPFARPTCTACPSGSFFLSSLVFFLSSLFSILHNRRSVQRVYAQMCVDGFHIYLAGDVGESAGSRRAPAPETRRVFVTRPKESIVPRPWSVCMVRLRKGGRSFRTVPEMLICISAWMRSPDYEALFADRLRGWNPDRFSARLED